MNDTVVFVASDRLGTGDDELGAALMLSALAALPKLAPPPARVIFMNAGVRLCCAGSPALPALRELAALGADLACCGTCLDWYELRDRLEAGRVSNMVEILSLQAAGARVIRL